LWSGRRLFGIKYRTARNEDTRCHFCKNDCLRTFIDVNTGGLQFLPIGDLAAKPSKSKVPLMAGEIHQR
jgi:hypothetical protein